MKINRTDHKPHFILHINYNMFRHQGAIFIGFIKNKESYIQHVLQVPVTLPVIKNLKILQLQMLNSTVHTAVITTYIDGPLVLFKSQLFIFSSFCIQTSLTIDDPM